MSAATLFDPLAMSLIRIARDHEINITQQGILAGLPLPNGKLIPQYFSRAAERVGLSSNIIQQPLQQINTLVLPAIVLLKDHSACVMYKFDQSTQVATVYFPELGDTVTEIPIAQLQEKYLGSMIYLQIGRAHV